MAEILGFDVLTAGDGRQAIDVFRRHAGDIAVVVLDLVMPHMDGVETLRELRRLRIDVPVLLATGYDEQETMKKFQDLGFAGFLQKPYRLSNLSDKLRQALEAAGRESAPLAVTESSTVDLTGWVAPSAPGRGSG